MKQNETKQIWTNNESISSLNADKLKRTVNQSMEKVTTDNNIKTNKNLQRFFQQKRKRKKKQFKFNKWIKCKTKAPISSDFNDFTQSTFE